MLWLVPEQGKIIFLPNRVSLARHVHSYVKVRSSRTWVKAVNCWLSMKPWKPACCWSGVCTWLHAQRGS